jgi:thioesterase domain-containing protein
VPRPYAGPITLFSAAEALDAGSRAASRSGISRLIRTGRAKIRAILKDQALGWGQLAGDGIKIYNVPGNHYTMLAEPHVQQLAKQLQSCLDGSLASQAGEHNAEGTPEPL